MLINVKTKPSAGENRIEKIDDMHFVISVQEPPVQGRANTAIIKLLAGYFGVAPSEIAIVSGHISRNKIIQIK